MERVALECLPGTLSDEALLDDRTDNLLTAVHSLENEFGIATLDMSSGRFKVLQVNDKTELHSELQRLNPVEILISEDFASMDWLHNWGSVRQQPPWLFDYDSANRLLNSQLGTKDLTSFGCAHLPIAICAAGVYCSMQRILSGSLPHIGAISVEHREDSIALDAASRRNLELDVNLVGGQENTLFSVLDKTATSMAS